MKSKDVSTTFGKQGHLALAEVVTDADNVPMFVGRTCEQGWLYIHIPALFQFRKQQISCFCNLQMCCFLVHTYTREKKWLQLISCSFKSKSLLVMASIKNGGMFVLLAKNRNQNQIKVSGEEKPVLELYSFSLGHSRCGQQNCTCQLPCCEAACIVEFFSSYYKGLPDWKTSLFPR